MRACNLNTSQAGEVHHQPKVDAKMSGKKTRINEKAKLERLDHPFDHLELKIRN